ncbi:AAA family ATPase [Mycoplasma hafezii]|uniref:AAA family ATPase n=1 Tax=Mycoplasma hafezii TaxID=525886 RepID=UPI003CED6132
MKQENEKYKGVFIKIFKQEENKWALMCFQDSSTNKTFNVFATGITPRLRTNYEIEVVQNNAQYKSSKRLIKYVPALAEKKEVDWEDFFIKNIKNVGKKSAEIAAKNFGPKIFELLNDFDKNAPLLYGVLTTKQIDGFIQFYSKEENKRLINELMLSSEETNENIRFFYEHNLIELYEFLNKKYGFMNFVEYFKLNNPYLLYLNDGIDLNQVDKFALEIGWNQLSSQRFKAYLHSIMSELEEENSTIISSEEVYKKLLSYFQTDENILEDLMSQQIKANFIHTKWINDEVFLYLDTTYQKELYIANKLKSIDTKPLYLNSLNPVELTMLSEDQKQAYDNFLKNNVVVITGGPGTGKSFLIKKINQTLKANKYKNQKDYVILAPTGRAATNVSLKADAKVKTIHSFLKIGSDSEDVVYEEERDDIKILVIDEFSMVNLNIFFKLLVNCPNLEKIVLIGDINQLPAIGSGNLLYDIITSEKFQVSYLYEYFRSDSEEIWNHFNNIKKNKIPPFASGIVDLVEFDISDMDQKIVDLYCDILKANGLENVSLLAPMYRGNVGLHNLNNLIQNKINPNGEEVYKTKRLGTEVVYRIGDRVMQQENRVNDDIYNGDFGLITRVINNKSSGNNKTIVVSFTNETTQVTKHIEYTEKEFRDQISLAYGVTVHKFQGSEIDNVIFLVHPSHTFMLNKKMIYTATSRAKKHLWIVTTSGDFYYQLLLNSHFKQKQIYTNLLEKLKED